jgi:hypothetical protein
MSRGRDGDHRMSFSVHQVDVRAQTGAAVVGCLGGLHTGQGELGEVAATGAAGGDWPKPDYDGVRGGSAGGHGCEIFEVRTPHVPVKPAAETLTVFVKVGWVGFSSIPITGEDPFPLWPSQHLQALLLYHLPSHVTCVITRRRWATWTASRL